jgi:periplasmic protein TonB
MLQSPTTRKLSAAAVDAASQAQHRRKLFLAMIILFATLIVILVRDSQLWWTSTDAPVAEDDAYAAPSAAVSPSASTSIATVQTPAAPVVKTAKHVAVAKPSPEKPSVPPAIVASNRTPLPPLGIEVVAGDSGKNIHLSNTSSGVSNSARIVSTPVSTPQLTKVSQRTVASNPAQAPDQTVVAEYPLLARQMKVQGSVLMQALIATNGVIEDLRVISGPAILAAAARQAVMQYHFKPYLQNGQPVETSARVTVNFAIRVVGDQTALRVGGGSTSGGD